MILKLRMFCSHLLVTQDIVRRILTDDLMLELQTLSNKKKSPDHPSREITRWLGTLRKKVTMPKPTQTAQLEGSAQLESQEIQLNQAPLELRGDRAKLVQEFHKFMFELHANEQWFERLERTSCPRCGLFPVEATITSCKHLYCDECYCALVRETPENDKPTCQGCAILIDEAAYCGSVDDIEIDISTHAASTQAKAAEKRKGQPKKKFTCGRNGLYSAARRRNAAKKGFVEGEDDGPDPDNWLINDALQMPGAKLTYIKELITKWIAENKEVKIVVFTQFLDFVHILAAMCEREKWEYVRFTGKMPIESREQSLTDFKEKKEMRVLISSFRAGGTGIDMSMASKCILVDLWCNEALQEQALCRLFRIGQERNVEFVKLVVKDTIDEYMLDMQLEKKFEIDNTIGEDVLKQRQTIKELLELFDLNKDGNGLGPSRRAFGGRRHAVEYDDDSSDYD